MEKIKTVRNVLFKSFILGYGLLLVFALYYHFYSDSFLMLLEKMYGLAPDMAKGLTLYAMTIMKTITIYFFLIPTIALHWECKKCKCRLFKKKG